MVRLTLFLACLTAGPLAAEPQCAQRAVVLQQLADRYGEARQGIGLSAGNLMEVFASASGSWTVTLTTAHGLTCLIASGEGWEAIAEPFPAIGVPG